MDPTTGLAWESPERSFFDRLWSTVRDATIDPVATFRATGIPGSGGAALRFTLITSAIGYLPLLMFVPCIGVVMLSMASVIMNMPEIPAAVRGIGAGAMCGVIASIPIFVVVFSLYVELLYALVFHLLALLAGGKGSFGASTRAMLYTGAIRFWLFVPLLLGIIPFVGFILHWGCRLAMLVWSGFAVYGAAEGVHQLPQDRAIFVGIATPFLVLLLSIAGGGLFVVAVGALLFGGLTGLGSLIPHAPY
jgi:hypothetical protein